MGRRPCCSKDDGLNRGAWTAEEDEILVSHIRSHGEGKWRSLPKRAGLNRCGKSCRLRWLNYLRPNIKRGNISEQEEDLIIRLHKLLGNRWSLIAGRLPGRTDNEIKNYWNTTLWKKLHGRLPRAPKTKPMTDGKQRKPAAEKTLAEPAPSQASVEDVSGERVLHREPHMDTPFIPRQDLSSAATRSPMSSGRNPLADNSWNDATMGLNLTEDMCSRTCPPPDSPSLFLVGGDGDGEGVPGVAAVATGDEEDRCNVSPPPFNSDDVLFDSAAPGDWLENGVTPLAFPSDFQFVASFLNLEEWL